MYELREISEPAPKQPRASASAKSEEPEENSAPWDLKKTFALARLDAELRALTNKDLSGLVADCTAKEVACALNIVELLRQYNCGYEEVHAALRLRKRQNEHHARYHQNHREEANLKNAARMREKRGREKMKKSAQSESTT